MKVAVLTTDNREHERCYTETVPRFGTAPEALWQGLELLPELKMHGVSPSQQHLGKHADAALQQHTMFNSL